MAISMIWAMARNRAIGKDNKLLWHLPSDLKHFKETTLGKPVIMGLRTFQSLGKPLPGRRNIILHFETIELPEKCELALSIPEAMEKVKDEKEAFVIGGAMIYKQFLPLASRLYMTYIDQEFTGDVYFPEFDMKEWKLISNVKGVKDYKNPYDYYFRVYERK
jgi:dihydrofolate reductase